MTGTLGSDIRQGRGESSFDPVWGSVVPDDAAALLSRPGIDGVLIGGASLIANEFVAIARSAIAETQARSV